LAQAPPAGDPYDWAAHVEAMRRTAEGWLAHRQGRAQEALALMRAAAELEDTTGKHPVSPGSVLPARESLADLLYAMGRPAEALAEYEAVLAVTPGRLGALAGAVRSALAAEQSARGRELASQILAQCDPAAGWPEVTLARTTVAGQLGAGPER
jgi:tetratricopeptide (TPR) repeat protein